MIKKRLKKKRNITIFSLSSVAIFAIFLITLYLIASLTRYNGKLSYPLKIEINKTSIVITEKGNRITQVIDRSEIRSIEMLEVPEIPNPTSIPYVRYKLMAITHDDMSYELLAYSSPGETIFFLEELYSDLSNWLAS